MFGWNHSARPFALLLIVWVLVFSERVAAETTLRALDYQFSGENLYISVYASKRGKLLVRHRPINRLGKAVGRGRTKRFDVEPGQNDLALAGDANGGREVQLTLHNTRIKLLANRGVWFTTPRDRFVATSRTSAYFSGFDARADKMLAAGFDVSFGLRSEGDETVSIERTLGLDNGIGMAVDPDLALVLYLQGPGVPCKVTVGERVHRGAMQYWDYDLVFGTTYARYEIPLRKFLPRSSRRKSLRSIYSVTIRPLLPLKAGDRIHVAYLGLTSGGPHISKIKTKKNGVNFVQLDGAKHRSGALFASDVAGSESTSRLRGRQIAVPRSASKIWVCHTKPNVHALSATEDPTDVARICDPADAPFSSYGVAPDAGSLLIDRFDTQVPVNAFRLPVSVFGSSVEVEQALTQERLEESLRITYYPKGEEDHAGYLSYLPTALPKKYRSLAVTLRGSIPPNNILIGVKDKTGREARIPIISYWPGDETEVNPLYDFESMRLKKDNPAFQIDGDYRTVLIPIDAFEAVFYNVFEGHAHLKEIQAVSVTMKYGGESVFHGIELKQIAFTDIKVPIVITAFDGDQYGINALGGVNFSEQDRGGLIDVHLNADGYFSQGLRVQVTLDRNESYGLVAMGFGRLDVSDYSSLTFSVRGEHGSENAVIYLNDGKKRASVALKDHIVVTPMWRHAKIPLGAFAEAGVNLKRVSQLILAWEGERIYDRVLYFDNFIFE